MMTALTVPLHPSMAENLTSASHHQLHFRYSAQRIPAVVA